MTQDNYKLKDLEKQFKDKTGGGHGGKIVPTTDVTVRRCSLYLSPRQRRKVNALIRTSCCNYDRGNCIALDDGEPCVCVQSISYTLCCTWFRDWLLPGTPILYSEIMEVKGVKRCECGALFQAKSNRAKYCAECACQVHRRQKTASDRKRRSRNDK